MALPRCSLPIGVLEVLVVAGLVAVVEVRVLGPVLGHTVPVLVMKVQDAIWRALVPEGLPIGRFALFHELLDVARVVDHWWWIALWQCAIFVAVEGHGDADFAFGGGGRDEK